MKKSFTLFSVLTLFLMLLFPVSVKAADTVLKFSWTETEYHDGRDWPANGDFSYNGYIGDGCNLWDSDWAGMKGDITATSRNTYSLKKGENYTFTLRVKWTENRNNCRVPKIQINSETAVEHSNVDFSGGNLQDLTYSVDVPSDGDYTIKVITQEGDREKFGVSTLTIPEAAIGGSVLRTFKSGEKIYFKDAVNNFDFNAIWKVSNGAVYAYFWNTGENDSYSEWSSYGTPALGNDNIAGTVYELMVPGSGKEFTHVQFTRGDGYNHRWHKSIDCAHPEEGLNLFNIDNVTGNKVGEAYNGSWAKFTPSGKTVYFDARIAPDTWTTAYVRIGHGSHNYAWGPMTKVAGTKCLYSQVTDAYANHTEFSVANGFGWTSGNNVVQPWSGQSLSDGQIISKQTNYQQFAIEKDIYICPQATSITENGCQYYTVDGESISSHTDANKAAVSLPQYTVTATGTNCTVGLVEYTNDGLTTSQAITENKVDPTRYVGVTITPSEGYEFSSISLTEDAFEQHTAATGSVTGKYAIMADCEISAECTAINYNVTYSAPSNGSYTISVAGGEASSSTQTANIGQTISLEATSLPGYAFNGWIIKKTLDNSDVTASVSLSGTETATFTMPVYDVTVIATFAALPTYTITVPDNANGAVSADVASAYEGKTITLTASANPGYAFDSWTIKKTSDNSDVTASVGLSGTTTATFTMPDYGVTVVATFNEAVTYAVTVNKNADYGTVTGASNYVEGATVNISATPYGGYEFVNWTTNDGVTFANANSASTSFTMIGSAVTVQANFIAETCESGYTLECEDYIEFTTAGSGTTNKPSGASDNYPSKLKASSGTDYGTPHGGSFANFDGSGPAEMWMPVTLPTGTYSFTVVGGHSFNMWFNLYNASTGAKVQYYQLLNNSWQDGFITQTTSSYALSAGDYIIGLYGDNGWSAFDEVIVNNVSTYSVTYNASGAQSGSTISAAASGSDLISGNSVDACTEVTFTATPASGYVVEHWQVNGVTYPAADGLTDFTLAINRNVTVTYTTTEASTYSVTVNVNDNLYGSATGAGTYSSGDEVTLSATPESGYGFVNWTTEDGVTFADATAAETTFTMPSKNVAVQANFAPLRTVNYEVVGGNGTVACAAVSSGGTVVSGRTLTFTATPGAGYSVLGWYTYDGATETLQANTRAQNSFNYTISSNITIRVKFTKIRIATGDANLGNHDGYSGNNASMSVSNVVDLASKFDHKVLQITYTMNSADNESSYYGMSLPVDADYTTSIASGKTGMGFWYRTASTTDKVLIYFCIGGTDGSNQFENLLPATNGKWQYWYIETDKVDDNTTFGFYINGTKNSKSTGVIGSEAQVWLSEVEPLTPADVTVNSNETKEIAQVVRDLTIYQGGQVTNEEDIVVARNIYYVRPAKDNGEEGKLGNNLDQWYTFAVPFTVSDVEVYDETDTRWYDINAVYYSNDATDQSSNNPDGAGHYYLQYLKDADAGNIGTFKNRWQYITPSHSEYINSEYGYRYGYPKKDEAYIILFDSDQPIGNYFQTNTQIRFVGGPQTIDGTAKEWKVEAEGEKYYMYANNTLHSFTLTGDAYLLNDAGTNFDLQSTPTIRPFECYIQATEAMKAKYSSIPMRWTLEPETPTGTEGIQHSDSGVQKVMRNGQLYIIRNGQWYNADGSLVCTNKF